jgi:hypothetical protein
MIKLFSKKTKGMCNICEKTFNEDKLTEINELWLCKKHLKLYNNSSWVLYKKATSDPEDPVEGIKLYNHQQELRDFGFYSFLKSSYEENDGKIFTTIALYCRSEDLENLVKKKSL